MYFLLKMVIFHCYFSLPEGKIFFFLRGLCGIKCNDPTPWFSFFLSMLEWQVLVYMDSLLPAPAPSGVPIIHPTWRISPVSKWLITMVIVFVPKTCGYSPSKWPNFMAYKWGWSDHHVSES